MTRCTILLLFLVAPATAFAQAECLSQPDGRGVDPPVAEKTQQLAPGGEIPPFRAGEAAPAEAGGAGTEDRREAGEALSRSDGQGENGCRWGLEFILGSLSRADVEDLPAGFDRTSARRFGDSSDLLMQSAGLFFRYDFNLGACRIRPKLQAGFNIYETRDPEDATVKTNLQGIPKYFGRPGWKARVGAGPVVSAAVDMATPLRFFDGSLTLGAAVVGLKRETFTPLTALEAATGKDYHHRSSNLLFFEPLRMGLVRGGTQVILGIGKQFTLSILHDLDFSRAVEDR